MPRHDLNALSLIAGAAFAGLALASLLDGVGAPANLVLPLLLIVVGVVGLLSARSRGPERSPRADKPRPD